MTVAPTNPVQLLEELSRTPVEDRAHMLRARGPMNETLAALIDHASHLTSVDASKAVEATDIVVNLADRVGSQLDRARARRARARALSYTGRFEDALAVAREGARLAEEAGHSIEAGRARLASMHALGEMGRLEEAIRVGEAAREAFLAAGEPALAARADINLGTAHQRRDELAAAVEYFQRAKPYFLNEPLVLGHLENNRGEALVALNDFAGAEAAFNSALASFQNAHASLTAAIAEGNLADLAARRGLLHRALYHFERARRQLEGDAAAGHLARLIAEQADALSILGMPQEAMSHYEAALPQLDRCGLTLEAARARAGMGSTLIRLNRLAEAETALAAAANAFEELGHRTLRGRVNLLRAELALMNRRIAEAHRLALRSMEMLNERPVETAAARRVLAQIAIATGHIDEAYADLAIGLRLARQLDLAPLQADLLLTRGMLHRKQGRVDEAVADLAAAVEQVERLRGALQAERFRAAFQGDRSAVYEQFVLALLERRSEESTARAFSAVEQAKSRALLDRMRGVFEAESLDRRAASEFSPDESPDASESHVLAQAMRLRAELNALYSRVQDELHPHSTTHDSWRQIVRRNEEQLDAIEDRLAATRGMGGLFARTASLDDLRAIIPTGTAVVEYFIADGELIAFVSDHAGTEVFRQLAGAEDVHAALKRVHFQMNRALRPGALSGDRAARLVDDARRELMKLHELTLAPLRVRVDTSQRLIIVPHGLLHLAPFHALWNGREYLIQSHEICYAPSASLLVHLQRRARKLVENVDRLEPVNALVVGVNDEFAPQIAREAEEVAAALECPPQRLLVGAAATRRRVRAATAGATILHLACHGRFAADTPQGSGLRIADGWLTVRDICDLQLDADLVTLSGCETGLVQVQQGDELTGLLRGFFAAGAASLLVSLWRVNDQATRQFMVEFYHAYANEPTRAAVRALRFAQIRMLDQCKHPALWAPFMLAGGMK